MSNAPPNNTWQSERTKYPVAQYVGTAFIAVAILGGLSNIVLVAALNRSNPQATPPANSSQAEREAWQRGSDAAPGCNLCVAFLVSFIYIPVLIGGLKLRRGKGYQIGRISAVIAMLPCSPAFLVGLPVGIWAIMTLNRPGMKEALTLLPRKKNRPKREQIDGDDKPWHRKS